MHRHRASRRTAGVFVALALAAAARGQTPAPSPTPTPVPVHEDVVVSATRGSEIETEIPGEVTVITGEELRRKNVFNLADALQDVVGLDTGMGSDNGPRQPNVGLWGLKEFDALLFMVDGVPVGGPFNPSLSQINIADIDHIEIVKGPQGTLYGVSAFAGMVQVFTKSAQQGSSFTFAGGSFNNYHVNGTTAIPIGASMLRVFGSFDNDHGWQDRTNYRDSRGGFRLDTPLSGGGHFSLTYTMYLNTQDFGSPLPVDPPTGEVIPGFVIDRNYEVIGARLDHRVYSTTASASFPLGSSSALETVLGFTRDNKISVQSFIGEVDGNTATASGLNLKPEETDVYADVHLIHRFEAAGHHRLVTGAAVTWGRTTAAGHGFDFELQIDPVVVPNLSDIPPGDDRSFEDRRTFGGFYANDEWTPVPFLTITGGARLDLTSESLVARVHELSEPDTEVSKDSKSFNQWSGGGSILGRIVTDRPGVLNEANLYFSGKTAFKPAAPNLTEAESAQILEPERTVSYEVGVKTRGLDRQLAFEASFFDMTFHNLVTSIVGPDGNPMLVNAGEEKFKGAEFKLGYRPAALPDLALLAGYAHHDAKYVHFSFIDPDNGLTVADGQRPELTPRDLWNASVAWQPATGPGAWFAIRHQNHRPFDKINEAYMPSFFEYDAGLSYVWGPARLAFVARNIGNSRHYVAESEIGDSQNYVAPPRRFLGELTVRF
jgi:iron complex outermembrane receptor protein